MSEFNPESLENNCRSLRMEPSLSDSQVAWIMDLANKSEQLTAELSRLRKAIEKHKKHATELAPKDANGNPVFAHIDGELYNALEGK